MGAESGAFSNTCTHRSREASRSRMGKYPDHKVLDETGSERRCCCISLRYGSVTVVIGALGYITWWVIIIEHNHVILLFHLKSQYHESSLNSVHNIMKSCPNRILKINTSKPQNPTPEIHRN